MIFQVIKIKLLFQKISIFLTISLIRKIIKLCIVYLLQLFLVASVSGTHLKGEYQIIVHTKMVLLSMYLV